MIFTTRWFFLFLLGVIPLALAAAVRGAGALTLVWVALLLIVTIVDFLLLPLPDAISVERKLEPHFSLGAENLVTLSVHNATNWTWSIVVRDEPPVEISEEPTVAAIRLEPGQRTTVEYHLRPTKRGDVKFGDTWIRVSGRLGLVCRQWKRPGSENIKIYPNLLETAKFNLMAKRGRLQQIGIRAARLIGAGREFESLRDYQIDDDYRRIDWKATARKGKLISRQFEVERSQNIILVLDVGRTMLAEIDGIAKLDYAVNAALLLAYVATLADDKVGLLVFADKVETWIPPQKGRAQVYRILDALYNAKATLAEPDYRGAFAYLGTRWRRRSLLVCFTDLWDPDSSRQTITQLASLQPRHMVACVTLLDTKVLRRIEAPIENAQDVFEQAVGMQVLHDRTRATAELKRKGVIVVDTPAEKLSAALVNRYLEVKERL